MGQHDTSDLAAPQAGKVAPEAVALRAQSQPVTRLNRRALALLTGGLSVALLGAMIWSLQPHRRGAGEQNELFNVDRVSKSEGLDQLPSDYSKLRKVPELGPPLPGDLGTAIVKSQQPVYGPPGHDPEDALRCSSARPASVPQLRLQARLAPHRAPWLLAWRASIRWRQARLRRPPSLPIQRLFKTGKIRKRDSRKPELRKPAIPATCKCRHPPTRSWQGR